MTATPPTRQFEVLVPAPPAQVACSAASGPALVQVSVPVTTVPGAAVGGTPMIATDRSAEVVDGVTVSVAVSQDVAFGAGAQTR